VARKPPPLSDEEKALFRAAMADVTRVRPAPPPVPRAAPLPSPPKPVALRAAPPAPSPRRPELTPGGAADTDGRTIRKLVRGQIRPEAALDLHGHTLARAHVSLHRFIARMQGRGARCAIVITGRGALDGPTLRAEVPRWLNEPALRKLILGFSEAQPQDGGAGALYVLLRRARQ
jgi:DNA-nicking Smr family endonuclease